ncbi:MAG: PQQ-binding-like beta-propeller repeat protein, partial [Phycisphaerae bacterium]
VLLAWCSAAPADWPTARGNDARTGNLDDRAGPKTPEVLWAYKAREHFVGSPVPDLDSLYVPGLGAFNTGTFHCLSLATDAAQRVRWSKATPLLKRPTVCSPAISQGLIVLGDGMHQTDNAILYCFRRDTGRALWQLPVLGRLVHIEGTPTISGGRVYVGGGDAGVLCVDLGRAKLGEREHTLDQIDELLEKRWKELLAEYEEAKKKDPEFAIAPGEDALPKPVPRLLWQAGKGEWHVDAPVAVSTGRGYVYVPSAYLDEEKCGKRALLCLRARSSKEVSVRWEVPLKINPWGGVTIADRSTVLVACSSIRFDPKRIADARGEVVAVDGSDGRVRWRKDVPGGVLSTVVSAQGLAVFTATDGKVRAWNVSDGQQRWLFEAAHPFFAGPAIAKDMVYVVDINGVAYGLDLATGRKQWSLNVPADPLVQSPGMVFGSPVVHGGRLYMATANLMGQSTDQPSAIVCVADASAVAREKAAVVVSVDKAGRTVTIPCRVAPRKLPNLKEIYPIEVMATYPSPRGQKAHETVVTFLAKPSDVHKALEGLGLKPGRPSKGQGAAEGPEVTISLSFTAAGGNTRTVPIERVLVDRRTGRPMPPIRWHFTGSVMKQPDPERPLKVYGADYSGTLIALFPVTDETVFQSSLTLNEERLLKMDTNNLMLPPEYTPASLIIAARAPSAPVAGDDEEPVRHDLSFSSLGFFYTAPQPSPTATLTGEWGEGPPAASEIRAGPLPLAL